MAELQTTTLALGSGERTLSFTLTHVAKPGDEAARKKQCDLWAFVWASGAVAAELLWSAASTGVVPKLRSAELGSGAGLPSLVAGHFCGWEAVATDLVEDALSLLGMNADHLRSTTECKGSLFTQKLDWNAVDLPPALLNQFSLVIGADVLYLTSNVRPVLRTAAAMLEHGGVVLLVDPGRPTTFELEDEAAAQGLTLLLREDIDNLQTTVALMSRCTVFLLQKSSADVGAEPTPLVAALMGAISDLRAQSQFSDRAAGSGDPTAPKYAYTLDVTLKSK